MNHDSPPNDLSDWASGSRTSTPPTEPLSGRSSPDFVLPPETEEMRQRHAQSDRASSAIGSLMLKGWAMLGDECPNNACYGIPLVRPPKQGGVISSTSKCVACETIYECSGLSWKAIAPPVAVQPTASTSPSSGPTAQQASTARSDADGASTNTLAIGEPRIHLQSVDKTSTPSALNESIGALENSLKALSQRLNALSGPDPLHIDPGQISTTAQSMKTVIEVLHKARHALRSKGD